MNISNIAKEASRRQKRLLFLQQEFSKKTTLANHQIESIRSKLNVYKQLIAKFVTAGNETDINEAYLRLDTLDRELITIFDLSRLSSSSMSSMKK